MKIRLTDLLYIVLVLSMAFISVSCKETGEEPKVIQECQRTVLVYQVANNNLGSSGYNEQDIEEMREGADAGKIPADGRLLVYNAKPNANPLLLEIKSNRVDTLKIYDNDVFSVSSKRMYDVFKDVNTLAPSKEFGLVLWSHGSGWLQDGIEDDAEPEISTLSFGSEKGNTMNISTLAKVLRNGPKLSFLYFDCCYMASVETLYELRDVAPVIIGSATELLVYGMPYQDNIEHFFSDENALTKAAENTFNLYNGQSGMSRTCTMSVIDTQYLEELGRTTAAIYAKATPALPKTYKPQRFMSLSVQSCLYFDFENYVEALCLDSNGSERFEDASHYLAAFREALGKCVLYSAATPRLWNEFDIKYHCGLSTYIVEDESKITNKNYNTLQWYTDVVSNLKF